MEYKTRKLLDKSFTFMGISSISLITIFILILLLPIFYKGFDAIVFRQTVENQKFLLHKFERGNKNEVAQNIVRAQKARQPVYKMLKRFKNEMLANKTLTNEYGEEFDKLKERIYTLLGPPPETPEHPMLRKQIGQIRWDRAKAHLNKVLYEESYDYSNPSEMSVKVITPRKNFFIGTSLEPLFRIIERDIEEMMQPEWTFYWGFFLDESFDAHMYGGIFHEIIGTLYLTIGAMLFAIPFGIFSAIYLTEYAGQGLIIKFIRISISTLAGVPSIVYGLFGLTFFINTLRVSESKSVLAGSLTLALLIMPTIIRAAEEAILAVPKSYKEASLALGASKWKTITSVILPSALPGILTGIIISMGRAAGETAPIIFTAAVSMGAVPVIFNVLSEPTPALPWNIYNIVSEHPMVEEIRHVQFGMVATLITLVLLLNTVAIIIRAKNK